MEKIKISRAGNKITITNPAENPEMDTIEVKIGSFKCDQRFVKPGESREMKLEGSPITGALKIQALGWPEETVAIDTRNIVSL